MNTYQQLTQAQRYQIYAHKQMGHNQLRLRKPSVCIKRPSVGNWGAIVVSAVTVPNKPTIWGSLGVYKAKRRICAETWRWIECQVTIRNTHR